MTPDDTLNDAHKKFMSKVRACHETINRRLKQRRCLQQLRRHDRKKHHLVFAAVVTMVQTEFEHGHRPFQVTVVNDNVEFTTFDNE